MQTSLSPSICRLSSICQSEKAVDELNLAKQVVSCYPSNLPLPNHVNRLVALNRSPSRLKFSEALLGLHSMFNGSMILFENVVQVGLSSHPALPILRTSGFMFPANRETGRTYFH
jgi:hypothetical protein